MKFPRFRISAIFIAVVSTALAAFFGKVVPNTALAQDPTDAGCCVCPAPACPAPIRDHAYVAPNGQLDGGNGSAACPFATMQQAAASVLAAPTDGGEYGRTRIVEVLGPATLTGNITVPTLAKVMIQFHLGVSWTGKTTWTIDDALRFGVTSLHPQLYLLGDFREGEIIGDAVETVYVQKLTDAGSISPTLTIANIQTTGKVHADGGITPTVVTRDVFMFGPANGYVLDGINNLNLSSRFTSFQRKVDVLEMRDQKHPVFFDYVTYKNGGSAAALAQYGMIDAMFGATPKALRTNGPLNYDDASAFRLRAMWGANGLRTYTAATGSVVVREMGIETFGDYATPNNVYQSDGGI